MVMNHGFALEQLVVLHFARGINGRELDIPIGSEFEPLLVQIVALCNLPMQHQIALSDGVAGLERLGDG